MDEYWPEIIVEGKREKLFEHPYEKRVVRALFFQHDIPRPCGTEFPDPVCACGYYVLAWEGDILHDDAPLVQREKHG